MGVRPATDMGARASWVLAGTDSTTLTTATAVTVLEAAGKGEADSDALMTPPRVKVVIVVSTSRTYVAAGAIQAAAVPTAQVAPRRAT